MKKIVYFLALVIVVCLTSCHRAPKIQYVFFSQDTINNITEVRRSGSGKLVCNEYVFNDDETFSVQTNDRGMLVECSEYHRNGDIAICIADSMTFFDIDGYKVSEAKFKALYPEIYIKFLDNVHQIHETTYKY